MILRGGSGDSLFCYKTIVGIRKLSHLVRENLLCYYVVTKEKPLREAFLLRTQTHKKAYLIFAESKVSSVQDDRDYKNCSFDEDVKIRKIRSWASEPEILKIRY